jgi:hypothetical protein
LNSNTRANQKIKGLFIAGLKLHKITVRLGYDID